MSYFSFNHGQTLTGEVIETLKKTYSVMLSNQQFIFAVDAPSSTSGVYTLMNFFEENGRECVSIETTSFNYSNLEMYAAICDNDKFSFTNHSAADLKDKEPASGALYGIVDTYSLSNYGLEYNRIVFGDGSSITEDGLSGKFILTDHDGNSLVVRAIDGHYAFCPIGLNGECTGWSV
jgi:hypothetical protein